MKNKFDFQPKLFTALRNYSKERFMTDLMAGIIVGIVALPLAIAFGIASGVSPEKGLITAIIGGFIAVSYTHLDVYKRQDCFTSDIGVVEEVTNGTRANKSNNS